MARFQCLKHFSFECRHPQCKTYLCACTHKACLPRSDLVCDVICNSHKTREPLHFNSVVVSIPDPRKAGSRGEDSHFMSSNALGVFDGVGGWLDVGIDSGEYARELAILTENKLNSKIKVDLKSAVKNAVQENKLLGSSTICVAHLADNHIKVLNVGDSGLMIMRDGKIVFFSEQKMHGVNYPHQVSFHNSRDLEEAQYEDMKLRKNDILIFGTDGFWDNISENRIERIVRSHVSEWSRKASKSLAQAKKCYFIENVLETRTYERGPNYYDIADFSLKMSDLALCLANKACKVAHSSISTDSHFRKEGKLDDITVMLATTSWNPETFHKSITAQCPPCSGNRNKHGNKF